MIYYSTGISPHLGVKGTKHEPFEKTALSLVERGLLVRSLSDLQEKVIDIPDAEIVVVKGVKVKPEKPAKPKGRKPVEKKKQAVKAKK